MGAFEGLSRFGFMARRRHEKMICFRVALSAVRVFCDAHTPLGKCDIELSMLSREQFRNMGVRK
jgi:hypothetical protein